MVQDTIKPDVPLPDTIHLTCFGHCYWFLVKLAALYIYLHLGLLVLLDYVFVSMNTSWDGVFWYVCIQYLTPLRGILRGASSYPLVLSSAFWRIEWLPRYIHSWLFVGSTFYSQLVSFVKMIVSLPTIRIPLFLVNFKVVLLKNKINKKWGTSPSSIICPLMTLGVWRALMVLRLAFIGRNCFGRLPLCLLDNPVPVWCGIFFEVWSFVPDLSKWTSDGYISLG